MVNDATLIVGKHLYRSNLMVSDSRYDVLLGIPCHVEKFPTVYYRLLRVFIGADHIPEDVDTPNVIIISSVGVKKCRSHLKNNWDGVDVFQVMVVTDGTKLERRPNETPRSVGRTLTQLDEIEREKLVAYFSLKLSATEENYTENKRDLLGLVYFLSYLGAV